MILNAVCGGIEGVGARYYPSVEDNIISFPDRCAICFFGACGAETKEMYVQGLSTSLPACIQYETYKILDGFEI